jgi:deoxycytidine triphosphate deaminase
VILSDISIREALGAGRIVIDPLDESCIQPSSIDVKISNLFRVFRNHTAPVIDVKTRALGWKSKHQLKYWVSDVRLIMELDKE